LRLVRDEPVPVPGDSQILVLDDLPCSTSASWSPGTRGLGPLLNDGCWTGPAERELFRLAAG
jgi:hypothetical protein